MFDETIFNLLSFDFEDEPDWGPLEALLPLPLCGRFMWMQTNRLEEVGAVQAYKHGETRMYLYLDADALPYERLGDGRFRRMRRGDAIEMALDTPWVLFHATDEEKEHLKAALRSAWEADGQGVDPDNQIAPCSPAAAFRWLP